MNAICAQSSPNLKPLLLLIPLKNMWQYEIIACYERIMKIIIMLCDRNAYRIWFEINAKIEWKKKKISKTKQKMIIIIFFLLSEFNTAHTIWSLKHGNNDDNLANWQTHINMISDIKRVHCIPSTKQSNKLNVCRSWLMMMPDAFVGFLL